MTRSTVLFLFFGVLASSQNQTTQDSKITYTKQEQALIATVQELSQSPLEGRGPVMKQVALDIRQLPSSLNKLRIADALAFVSLAGDPGKDALQNVATTLADALREQPGKLRSAYFNLAQLVHYEHVEASVDDKQFAAALSSFENEDRHRQAAAFTLADVNGKEWSLQGLRGKVVVLNFCAILSKPCWQEVGFLNELYHRFQKQDVAVLSIFAEDRERVSNFAKSVKLSYPILLDPEGKVGINLYGVAGFPKTFVYDRQGKLVAQAMDSRTKNQLLQMLKDAGVE